MDIISMLFFIMRLGTYSWLKNRSTLNPVVSLALFLGLVTNLWKDAKKSVVQIENIIAIKICDRNPLIRSHHSSLDMFILRCRDIRPCSYTSYIFHKIYRLRYELSIAVLAVLHGMLGKVRLIVRRACAVSLRRAVSGYRCQRKNWLLVGPQSLFPKEKLTPLSKKWLPNNNWMSS